MTVSHLTLWLAPSSTWDDSGERTSYSREARPGAAVPVDDQTLAASVRDGHQTAFDTLARRHLPALLHFAATLTDDMDARDDIVQTVLARVWVRRATFHPTGNVLAYLCAAVRNEALDARRRLAVNRRVAERVGRSPEYATSTEQPDVGGESTSSIPDDLAATLRRAFLALPPHYRSVLQLRYGQRLGYRDIAEALGATPKTAERLLARAVAALRREMTR